MQLNKGQIHDEKMLMQLGDTNSTFFFFPCDLVRAFDT